MPKMIRFLSVALLVVGLLLITINIAAKHRSEKHLKLQFIQDGQLDLFRSSAMSSPLAEAYFENIPKEGAYYASGIDCAPCNGIISENENAILSAASIDRAIAFFKTRNLPFVWWTSAKILKNKGFAYGGSLSGILRDLSHIRLIKASALPLTIKKATSDAELKTFSQLVIRVFEMKPSILEQFQAVNTAALKDGKQQHFLAYLNQMPIGAVTLSTGPSTTAGIWNLATLPEYRTQGVASALIETAMLEAQKAHYQQIMALLMTEEMAWGLFKKQGFKKAGKFPFYIYDASANKTLKE